MVLCYSSLNWLRKGQLKKIKESRRFLKIVRGLSYSPMSTREWHLICNGERSKINNLRFWSVQLDSFWMLKDFLKDNIHLLIQVTTSIIEVTDTNYNF